MPQDVKHPAARARRYRWPLLVGILCVLGAGLPAFGLVATPARAAASPLSLSWLAPTAQTSRAAAWGDVDGDGDLDLAIGGLGERGRVYRNCTVKTGAAGDPCGVQGGLSSTLLWEAPGATNTVALALADADGDGDLDLALANQGQPSVVYRNCTVKAAGGPCGGATGLHTSALLTTAAANSTSMAWGDVDGDGDLDMVLGNQAQASRLYVNGGTGNFGTPVTWQTGPLPSTQAVALGDVDLDGDLDLVLGNVSVDSQLYTNGCNPVAGACSAALTFSNAGWAPAGAASVNALAWGDVDGDGDLDLAVGNNGDTNKVFRNCRVKTGAQAGPCGASTGLGATAVFAAGANTNTTSLAWGDADGDGDLDLAVGNLSNSSQLFRNSGAALAPAPAPDWQPSSSLNTRALAWGDVNNDGSLDLALANQGQPSLVYTNALGPGFALDAAWDTSNFDAVGVAWGDADGDGDLDLAVAALRPPNNNPSNKRPSAILRNLCNPNPQGLCGGPGGFDNAAPIWQDAEGLDATAIAWGDVNGDGRLDLALAGESAGGEKRLVIATNAGATFSAAGRTTAAAMLSLAWGDVDGDGDLDLATGADTGSTLYRNGCNPGPSGACSVPAAPLTATNDLAASAGADTYAVAWGDVDGDGDLDLALGNSAQAGQLYRNTNGALALDGAWQATPGSQARSIAWGDVDGDGDLDLALGSEGQASQLYRNTNGALVLDAGWQPEPVDTQSIAWGDLDGDGDLDLVAANSGQPGQIYRNSGGVLALDPGAQLASDSYRGVSLGDADRDGDLDIALAIFNGPARVYRSGLAGVGTPADTPARVALRQPGTPAGALLSTARIIETTQIGIPFSLADAQGNRAGAVRGFYSLDGGGTWRPAGSRAGLAAAPAGQAYSFSWDTFDTGFFGSSDTVLFRIQAAVSAAPGVGNTGAYKYTGQVAGSVPRAAGGGATALFRARGTQIRVLLDGSPVAGAIVYRLGAAQSRGGAALADSSGAALRTNAQGFLVGRGAIAQGDLLAALAPAPAQPADKRDVRLFYTSPIDRDTGRPTFAVAKGVTGLQTLNAASGRPLFLFDVPLYLEWDARNDPAFLERLESDMQRASELLYDWSDGQAALGTMRLVADGSNPQLAGIHVYASNRLRPSAALGGIARTQIDDAPNVDQIYQPGSVSIGSIWSRYGGASGAVGEDWARAMAHEFGHYALFLEDNYIGEDASGRLISVLTCPGAMTDPYRDDYSEFQPRGAGWDANCARTFSQIDLGRADWETIKRFYPQMSAPATFNAVPGPRALTIGVTTVVPSTAAPSPTLTAPIVSLALADGRRYTYGPGSRARAFLYKAGDGQAIDLGAPTRDQVLARGASSGDRLCVYDLAAFLVGCATMSPTTSGLTLNSRPQWLPDVQITPLSLSSIRVRVPLSGVVSPSLSPTLEARVFPQSASPRSVALARTADGLAYGADIELGAPFDQATVRIRAIDSAGAALGLEAITDYTRYGPVVAPGAGLAGNPPNNAQCGPRPKCDAPLLGSTDGQMLVYGKGLASGQYYSVQTTTQPVAPPPWGVVVGQSYRLVTNMTPGQLTESKTSVTISYLDGELPAGTEGGLALYYWGPQGSWQQLAASQVDTDRNQLSAPAAGPGIYALIVQLDVREGWNLISYPWPQAEGVVAATARLNAAPGRQYTTIHGYSPQDAANPWKVYDADVPAWVNDLRQLDYGNGYWFIVPTGGAPPRAGAAVADVPTPPATYYGFLPQRGAPAQAGLPVVARAGTTVCAISTTFRPAGTQQTAFLIEVKPAGQGAPAGCGISGQRITVSVGGVAIGGAVWDNTRPVQLFRETFLPLVMRPGVASLGGSEGGGSSGDNPDEVPSEGIVGGPVR